ncbi:MAG: ferritin-like domain-containing protein [Deltaproteobacteria bacterium]|nr:ferritin-like domain-containing protein [Deltaproteobacteria bacterium]
MTTQNHNDFPGSSALDPVEISASQRWWQATRNDSARFDRWLLAQYRGEHTAAGRIEGLRDHYAPEGSRAYRLLSVIAKQERKHARWVGELLTSRGHALSTQGPAERYWDAPIQAISDLETACAVGAHAERMRLARIETIAEDPEAPSDVRSVFARILRDERFHERAFTSLSSTEKLAATRGAHELGRTALGLVA